MASFEELLGDVEKVKNQLRGSGIITRAGTSVSVPVDVNKVFQFLEEAGAVPNRVKVVIDRLNAREKKATIKKRKRSSSATAVCKDINPGSASICHNAREKTITKQRKRSSSATAISKDISPGPGKATSKERKHLSSTISISKCEMLTNLPPRYVKDRVENSSDEDVPKLVESLINVTDESLEENISLNDTFSSMDENNLADAIADISLSEEESVTMSTQSTSGDNVQQNYEILISIFPDLDPDFLKVKGGEIGENPTKFEAFICATLENKSKLPSKKVYDKKKSLREEQQNIKMWTVSDFFEMWDDPFEHFANTSAPVSDLYKKHAIYQLRKKFKDVHYPIVVKALADCNNHFFPTIKKIETMSPKKGKQKQAPLPLRPSVMDLVFLREYIYSKLASQIRQHQEKLELKHKKAVVNARKTGRVFNCQCCFDGDCLLTEVIMCEEGHMFCKDCVCRGVGVQIADQKTQISCLIYCGATFPSVVLQANLSSTVFSRLLQRRQLEEVLAVGLEDLVQCPACNFAAIMPDPLDKVIRCGNPECGKESCRLCQEDSHIPLTCEEVEKDSDMADRVKLEKAMTEAMLRTCVACGKKFFKEDGCNKMKCPCGATMCYICRKPVQNYSHFYGQGADPEDGKCPLWSDNKNLHKDEVFKAAEKVKKDLNRPVKYDPTKGIEKPPEGFDPNRIDNIAGGAAELDEDEADIGNEEEEEDDVIWVEDI